MKPIEEMTSEELAIELASAQRKLHNILDITNQWYNNTCESWLCVVRICEIIEEK